MFIIFGSPRSGTTLLAQCLSSHSKIFIPDETDLIVPMCLIFKRIANPTIGREMIYMLIANSNASKSILEFLTKKEIKQIVYSSEYNPSQILSKLYQEIAQTQNKTEAGDKSPNDINSVRHLGPILIDTDIKVLHIVRDIRDVMTSLIKLEWVPKIEEFYPREWSSNNLRLNWMLSGFPDRYLLVKYQDLVTNPKNVLGQITEFLGYQFEESMLSTTDFSDRYKKHPHHNKLYSPINNSSVGSYKNYLNKKQLTLIKKQACEGMQKFYPDSIRHNSISYFKKLIK